MEGIRSNRWRRLRSLGAAVGAVAIALIVSAAGADQRARVQLWVLSTRHLPFYPSALSEPEFDYRVLGPDGAWSSADEKTFLAARQPDVPTCVYIPGNRASWCSAIQDGWLGCQRVEAQAAGRPLRFLIWSWPADRVGRRNRPDVQEKDRRSDGQSVYLALWLRRVPPEVPVTLIGHSFGAKIITGAMHLLAGGEVCGESLPPTARRQGPVRAVLVAAAMDNDWLLPGHCHGSALRWLDGLLITVNCADPALRLYPALYGRRGPQALGFTGLPGLLGEELANVEQINLSGEVGRNHEWHCYAAAASLNCCLGRYVFGEAVSPALASLSEGSATAAASWARRREGASEAPGP